MTTNTIKAWLQRIGQDESFLQPRPLTTLSDQTLIKDRDTVIERVAHAIRHGQLIGIVHDYDVDGLSAGTILADGIQQMGGRVQTFSSSRFNGGGYGFSDVLCDQVLAAKPGMILTADCGGSDAPRIERLNAVGIDTCVIDHHVVPKEKLPALGFLNPHRPDCTSKYKHMCSGGLAWSVIGGLNKYLDAGVSASQFLDLAAISTIADVVELSTDNRAIVQAGLKRIGQSPRPGIQALLELNEKYRKGDSVSARDVGFRIAPGLNAPGRLGSPDIIVRLLMEKDYDQAKLIAKEVKDIWDKRRLITDVITEECLKVTMEHRYFQDPAIVIGHESYGHGIVGITAARIVDKFGKPCCVIGSEGRGSLRGPPGSRLYDALQYCSTHIEKWGGHQAAAGVKISWNQLDNFRKKFNEFFEANPSEEISSDQNVLDLDLSEDLITTADSLLLLEPTGQGNPKPQLRITGKVKSAKAVKGNHLKLDIVLGNGKSLGCFAIAKGDMTSSLISGIKVEVTGDLRKNAWMGRTSAEIFADSISIKS